MVIMTDSYKDCMVNITDSEKLYECLERLLKAGKCMSEVLWHLFHLLRNLCRAHETLEDVAQIYDEIIDINEAISTDFENSVK